MTPDQKEAFRREVQEAFDRAQYVPGDHPVVPVKMAQLMDDLRRALAASQPAPLSSYEDVFQEPDVLLRKLLRKPEGRDPQKYSAMLTIAEANAAGESLMRKDQIIDKQLNELEDLSRELESLRAASQPAPAADTGQAVKQYRRPGWPYWYDGTVEGEHFERRVLYTHPAPLDAERVLNDLLDNAPTDTIRKYLRSHGAVPLQKRVERAALRQKEGKA